MVYYPAPFRVANRQPQRGFRLRSCASAVIRTASYCAQGELLREVRARCRREGVMVNAQAGSLAWEDGTESLQWQSEARRWRWREDGCSDNRAGVCEPERTEDSGEDGISLGVVRRADHLQDGLRRLPSGVWGEWVRYPFAAVSGVPGGSGRRGAAGAATGVVWIRSYADSESLR